jgi:hypothetical protein
MVALKEGTAEITVKFTYPPELVMEMEGRHANIDTAMTVILTYMTMDSLDAIKGIMEATKVYEPKTGKETPSQLVCSIDAFKNGERLDVSWGDVQSQWADVMSKLRKDQATDETL